MNIAQPYLWYFVFVLLITAELTSAHWTRRKACDESINEVFSSCANPCKQVNCENRVYNTTLPPCTDPCYHGCVCKHGYVRAETENDPCVKFSVFSGRASCACNGRLHRRKSTVQQFY